MRVFHGKSDLPGLGSEDRAGRAAHRDGGWSATRPLASARPLQWGGRSTCNARVAVCRHSQRCEPSNTNGVERRS
jgi:hypothetical protein